jgi:hypothetical protein
MEGSEINAADLSIYPTSKGRIRLGMIAVRGAKWKVLA